MKVVEVHVGGAESEEEEVDEPLPSLFWDAAVLQTSFGAQ